MEEDRIRPVKPPRRKQAMNERTVRSSVSRDKMVRRLDDQVKSLTAVGIAMTMVAVEKYSLVSSDRPATNMWCAQTKNPTREIDWIASTMPM